MVINSNCDTKITELKKKIPSTTGLVKKADYDAKITETGNKISDIQKLVTKGDLTTALDFLLGKNYFSYVGSQNYLIFHTLLNTLKLFRLTMPSYWLEISRYIRKKT